MFLFLQLMYREQMKRDNFVHCAEDSPTNLLCTQFFFTALLACYTGSFYILCVLIISLIIIRLFCRPGRSSLCILYLKADWSCIFIHGAFLLFCPRNTISSFASVFVSVCSLFHFNYNKMWFLWM